MSVLFALFLVVGAFFAFVAAMGVLRFPDLLTRMHAATKAGAFGATLMLIAGVIHFGSLRASLTAAVIILFFYLTAPVAAQTVAQAAHQARVRIWKTSINRLADDEKQDLR